MSEYAVQAIVNALVAHLKTNVSALRKVYKEWPLPGQVLSMPCISVLTSTSRYIQGAPCKVSQSSIVNHKSDVLYYVGQYETTLQLHLWTPSKTDRAKYFDQVRNALDPDFDEGQNGLILTLDDYHDQLATYLFTGFDMPTGEQQAQRGEWRVILDVDVYCNAVRESNQAVMENIEVELETSTTELEE